jgi:hypothetical protein
MKTLSQDSRSPGRDLNLGPPEYEAGMLSLERKNRSLSLKNPCSGGSRNHFSLFEALKIKSVKCTLMGKIGVFRITIKQALIFDKT